jgi:hypothetical protein
VRDDAAEREQFFTASRAAGQVAVELRLLRDVEPPDRGRAHQLNDLVRGEWHVTGHAPPSAHHHAAERVPQGSDGDATPCDR